MRQRSDMGESLLNGNVQITIGWSGLWEGAYARKRGHGRVMAVA